MGDADALTGTLTADGNGLRRTIDGACEMFGHPHRPFTPRTFTSNTTATRLGVATVPCACGRRAHALIVVAEIDPHLGYTPSNVGRAPQAGADGDPLGASGPKESVR